jgi:branched-chain amino acid transport system substrate-binding protein
MKVRKWFAGAAVAAALVVAGCGSSGSSTSAGASASTELAAASAPKADVSGTAIPVGTICSCSGPLAQVIGKSLDVAQAWASYTNAHGGINGHPVKLYTIDDGQDPAKALEGVKELIQQDHVIAIVGQMSLADTAWASYAKASGVPVVGGQPVDTPYLTNPDFFASGSTLPLLLTGELALAKQSGAKTIGLMYCAETPVCAQLPPILSALAKPFGLSVAAQKVSTTAPNYLAPCLALKGDNAQALFVAMVSAVVPRVVDNCAQQGYKPVNIASSATTDRSWLTDSNLNGTLIAGTNAVYTDQSNPGVKVFSQALDEYDPGLRNSPEFSYPLIYPWTGGVLFQEAAKAAHITPSSTPADVKKGLYALHGTTLDGLAPPLSFVAGKPGFPTCYFAGKISSGSFQTLGSGKPTCIPAAQAAAIAKALGG